MPEERNDPLHTQQIFEQGEAAVINMAKLLGSYYKTLLEEGFTQDQALDLVLAYQTIMLGMRPNG